MVDGVDRARARYYKIYGGGDYESYKSKHILIDSSIMDINDTVAVLKEMAERRFGLK